MKFKKLASIVLSGVLIVSNIMLPSTTFANEISSNVEVNNVNESLSTPTIRLSANTVWFYWNKIENAMGYKVFRSTSEYGEYEEVAEVENLGDDSIESTRYIMSDLPKEQTFYFKIKAYNVLPSNEIIYSDYSNVISVKHTLFAPNHVTVCPINGSCNKVTWDKSYGAEGYKIFRSTNKYNGYELIGTVKYIGENTQTFEDTNVVANQIYYYKIASYVIVDGVEVLSDLTGRVEILTKLQTPTITVTNLKNTNTIKWDEVHDASGYKILYSNADGGYVELADIKNGDTLSYTHKGLEYGKTYYYKVKAYNSENNSIESKSSYATAKLTLTSTKAKATPNTYSSNKITWNKVSEADGYEVYKATSKTGTYSKVKTTSSLSYINTSLTTGKTYYYKVRTYRVVNGKKIYSSYSNTVSAKPVLKTPNVTLKAGSKKITIKWIKINGAKGYKIYRSTSKNGKYSLIKTTTSSSYTNSKLKKGGRYYYKVRAYRIVNGKTIYGNYSPIKNTKAM
ncbi:fibronectin type III domain-containing protein [Terrisporobacter hibernicus]|uniref:Fibronectin type-III domain-containing protein n=1 Tax=Terrisporobacter hibernicus TaxID=2813371 RepID=A0AAX2ZEA7_9FIRM|nr:hypothetical protein [Terrisporobacter hibernicus]UEL47597.1 hypothetical protein JW646_18560 [Terrisporobacter hibernicus]